MATVHDVIIHPNARPLVGIVPVAPDDEVAHLALLLAALAEGVSELRHLGDGADVSAVAAAIAALGVAVERAPDGTWRVRGVGLRGLSASASAIDVGTSPGALHALAGVLVAQPFASSLVGAGEWLASDVSELTAVLRLRGARIEGVFAPGRVGSVTLPLQIGALELPHLLGEIEHALARPDPRLKTALLLSGLFADGPTYVNEPLVSRDHIERLLQALDAPLATVGSMVHLASLGWGAELPSFQADIPGDFFGAALLLAAGLMLPKSRVGVRDVGLNRTRTGFLELAQLMGAGFEVAVHGNPLGEPTGVAMTEYAPLFGRVMEGEVLGRAASEVPALLALAARARGESLIGSWSSEGEGGALLAEHLAVLRAFGVPCECTPRGLEVEGRPDTDLAGADIACGGAGPTALALLLALVADRPSRLRGVDPLARRFPRFVGTLRALGADLHVEQRTE